MKKLLVILLAVLCLVSCAETYTESPETPEKVNAPRVYSFETSYVYYDSKDPIAPSINLNVAESRYSFTYSGFSSFMPVGEFEIKDGKLILWADDTKTDAYVFDITDEGYAFDAEESVVIPTYKVRGDSEERYSPVPDGALFQRKKMGEGQHNVEVYYGSVTRREAGSAIFDMTYKDTMAIAGIIEGKEWREGVTDCIRDCIINISGLQLQYHSDCGTLIRIDASPISSVKPDVYSLTLEEKAKEELNEILGKYIPLGSDIVED